MRKVWLAVLALVMAASLCACDLPILNGGNPGNGKPGSQNASPTKAPNGPCTYTVTVKDDTGKALENVMVVISTETDQSAGGGPTDVNGVLSQELLPGKNYQISLMNVPDEYVAEKYYQFTDFQADIVLKTAEQP